MEFHKATNKNQILFIQAESGNSVKPSVNRKLPAMAKLAVCVFEAGKAKASIEKGQNEA